MNNFFCFWAVAPKGTKSCRTQGDFCSSVRLFVHPPIHQASNPASQASNPASQALKLASQASNLASQASNLEQDCGNHVFSITRFDGLQTFFFKKVGKKVTIILQLLPKTHLH